MSAADPAAPPTRPSSRATSSRRCSAAVDPARSGAPSRGAVARRSRSRCSSTATPSGRRARPRCWAKLDHPHLVRLIEVVHQPRRGGAARVALVLELLEGGSLAALLARRGRLRPGEVVTTIAPVAAALAHAHANGVVHGDLSPGNIVFTAEGRPVLTDLGVARVLGEVGGRRGHPALRRPHGRPRRRSGAGLRRLRRGRGRVPRAHRHRAVERRHPGRHARGRGRRLPARPPRAGTRGPCRADRRRRARAVGRSARPWIRRGVRAGPAARLPPGAGAAARRGRPRRRPRPHRARPADRAHPPGARSAAATGTGRGRGQAGGPVVGRAGAADGRRGSSDRRAGRRSRASWSWPASPVSCGRPAAEEPTRPDVAAATSAAPSPAARRPPAEPPRAEDWAAVVGQLYDRRAAAFATGAVADARRRLRAGQRAARRRPDVRAGTGRGRRSAARLRARSGARGGDGRRRRPRRAGRGRPLAGLRAGGGGRGR